ncbi:dihydrodipicolinate synthase family protein [Sphingomonas sp. LM7]|uniref:dihydrodipicolinate synthase family protein n=1 Tax=Sphingomonas sp. LM7 TaxID=1938607 RepID=UPI0009839CFF|nr:dihydrodipicolinate synthase family protein [Sphingomonas sp. LM7]AQR72451.1 dihydrodipicolinate synthase family protein [Sphingomonas sp. LM7]
MTIATLGGVFPVLPTIFHEDGTIDEGGLVAVVDYVVAAGADGVVFPGLASEYDQLSLDERKRLIAVVGGAVRGRIGFIVGASADTVEDSAALLGAGAAAGASAAMVMTPRAVGRDLDALAGFYSALGARAGLPLMLQNAPAPMGLGLDPADVLHIVSHTDAIAWVKEENMPCGQRITALLEEGDARLAGVFGGAGGRYIVDELGRGAVGTMPAAETPEAHVALMAAHRRGDAEEVRRVYEAMLPILMVQAVFRWRLTKEILRSRGVIDSAYTRAPGPAFDAADLTELAVLLGRLEAKLA